MSQSALRRKLHEMTINDPSRGNDVSSHPLQPKDISKEHPNSIQILKSDIPKDCRCLAYALHLASNKGYLRIQRSSKPKIGIHLFAGKEFVEWLLDHMHLHEIHKSEVKGGDLVLYFDSNEWQHAGIVKGTNRIISKWGEGLLYEHDIFEVPDNYGSQVRFYQALAHSTAYQRFIEFVQHKTTSVSGRDVDSWLDSCEVPH